MRCCAPSALAVVHQLRSTFFFVFFGRGAAYSILALWHAVASLVSLRRRDVRLHSVCWVVLTIFLAGEVSAPVAGDKRGVFMAYNGSGVGQ